VLTCRLPGEDEDLGRVIEAWADLPPHIRASILALVEVAARA
jgi:hypothetical protein